MDRKLLHAAATPQHLETLIEEIRPADRAEVEASVGSLRLGVVDAYLRTEHPAVMIGPDGGLVCMYGVAPLHSLSSNGAIWLLGTSRMRKYAKRVLHDAKLFIEYAREHYPVLVNYVDARNTESVRWLAALGFTIEPPQPFGVQGLPFHRFHMGIDDV